MIVSRQLLKRWLWGLGILAVFLLAAWKLERLATLILLSFLFAYVLDPLVNRLSGLRFLGRTSATLITLFGLLLCFLAVLFVIVPEVVTEFRSFLKRLPDLLVGFQQKALPWIEQTTGVDVPDSWGEAFGQIRSGLDGKVDPEMIGSATAVVTGVFGRTFSAVFAVVGTLMFPLFLFFLLKDFPRIIASVDGLVPPRNKERVRALAKEVDASLSAFLHGQFTVMLVLGTLYSIGYSVVGIPVAIGVGLLTGLLCFIPYIGAAVGFALALVLSLLDWNGPGQVLGVVGVFATVQILDAILITPKILGGKLGLKPLWIIAALMAGGELFGFLGVLLAVPTTAVLKILVAHTIDRYRRSSLYLAEDEAQIEGIEGIERQSSRDGAGGAPPSEGESEPPAEPG